jgi:hypothetical protein
MAFDRTVLRKALLQLVSDRAKRIMAWRKLHSPVHPIFRISTVMTR